MQIPFYEVLKERNHSAGECLTPSAALTFFLGKRRCSAAEAESAFAVGKYDCRGAVGSKHRGSKRSLRGCLRQPFSHLCGGRLKKLFEKKFLKDLQKLLGLFYLPTGASTESSTNSMSFSFVSDIRTVLWVLAMILWARTGTATRRTSSGMQ